MSKIERCFGCTEEFTVANPPTLDHLIPQAIGGKLKVPFCTACHSTKIYQIDLAVTNQLHQIATFLNMVVLYM